MWILGPLGTNSRHHAYLVVQDERNVVPAQRPRAEWELGLNNNFCPVKGLCQGSRRGTLAAAKSVPGFCLIFHFLFHVIPHSANLSLNRIGDTAHISCIIQATWVPHSGLYQGLYYTTRRAPMSNVQGL